MLLNYWATSQDEHMLRAIRSPRFKITTKAEIGSLTLVCAAVVQSVSGKLGQHAKQFVPKFSEAKDYFGLFSDYALALNPPGHRRYNTRALGLLGHLS